MGSGLIYAIIIVVWAAYLMPSWLRRHDDAFGSRSVSKYRQAMRVVSKGTEAEIPVTEAERVEARERLRQRRMTVLVILASTFIITLTLAVLGAVAFWMPLAVLALGGIYISNVRKSVVAGAIQAQRMAAAEKAQRSKSTPRVFDQNAVVREKPRQATIITPVEPSEVAQSTTVNIVDAGWQPTETPLPTYATAPKAVRPHRVIDLTKPGEWTQAQREAEEARLAAIAPSRDEVFDQVAAEEAVKIAEDAKKRAVGD